MKTFQKHHFPAETWKGDLLGTDVESHSECTRCKIKVKIGRVGGYKFFVGGKWTSKRPPCQVSEGP